MESDSEFLLSARVCGAIVRQVGCRCSIYCQDVKDREYSGGSSIHSSQQQCTSRKSQGVDHPAPRKSFLMYWIFCRMPLVAVDTPGGR